MRKELEEIRRTGWESFFFSNYKPPPRIFTYFETESPVHIQLTHYVISAEVITHIGSKGS
jgi:hypothetical protein